MPKMHLRLRKGKVHSSFIDNIWGADLADMQLISKFDKRNFLFIMCYWYVINIYWFISTYIEHILYWFIVINKYAWVILLRDKKGITITDVFEKKNWKNIIANQKKYG